jgi:propanol-preferring alcohol dehydrogenase
MPAKMMRAMVLEEFGKPLQLREVPVPEIGDEEALVQVHACGLCGTDLKISGGKLAGIPTPLIMGHEPAGVVVEVGSRVTNVKVGDHVALALYVTCGQCEFCRTGNESLCVNLVGRPGFELNGGFAEYFKVPARNLFRVAPHVPFEQVALLADCIATIWHAVCRRAEVKIGQTVVVVGAGGLGVHAIQLLKLAGARVIAVDVAEDKLEFARQWGADVTIHSRQEDVVSRVKELTDGLGAHAVLEFVGLPETIAADLRFLRRGGVLTLVGYAPDKPFTADSADIVLLEKRIVGSRANTKQDLVEVIRLMEEGKIRGAITNRYRLEEVNEALEALRRGEILGRVVVVP